MTATLRLIVCAALLLLAGNGRVSASLALRTAQPQALSRLALAADQFANVNGARLRYREAGAGEAVVLLHGYGGQLEDLAPTADRLLLTNRVIALDARGFGQSSKSPDVANYGVKMADDVIGVLDALKIPKAHIVGHSMGALIAASAVARHPQRFQTATLIAGPFYPDVAAARRDLAPWLADLEGGRGMSAFLRWLFPTVPQETAQAMSAGMLQANDQPSLIAVMRSMPALAESAARVSAMPALVVVGSNDPLMSNNRAFVARSSGIKLLEVAGADHVSVGASRETMAAMLDLVRSKALR